jgi:DNA-directed RNA polymerase specialized sigma24 family protein
VRAVRNLSCFQSQRDGALHAYLRAPVMNRIGDEVRRRSREIAADGQSPLEEAIGAELLGKYDRALDRLGIGERDAVIARIEMGCSYTEIAETTGRAGADAARMAVSRALVRLAEEMRREQ